MPPRNEGVDPKNIVNEKRRPKPPKVFGGETNGSPVFPRSDQEQPQRRTPEDTPSPLPRTASLLVEAQGPMQNTVEDEGPEMAMNVPSAPAIRSLLSPPAVERPIPMPDGRRAARQEANAPEITFDHWSTSGLERPVGTSRGMSVTFDKRRVIDIDGQYT